MYESAYKNNSDCHCYQHQGVETPSLLEYLANMEPYPFKFNSEEINNQPQPGHSDVTLHLQNVRGRVPFPQASRLRSLWLEAHRDPAKILAFPCSYDGLSSRLIEEAGFPMIFISGFAVSSAHGLPDTGYIAMQEMCDKIQEVARQVTAPILADGDTGYGSPMNVRRTVESFAKAGAAGVMIEDQTWPKRKDFFCQKMMKLSC